MRADPDEVRLALVDIRDDRLRRFTGIPHLIAPVATDTATAADLLTWLREELGRRYADLSAAGCRTIDDYNQAVQHRSVPPPVRRSGGTDRPHAHIVVVIAELDILMRRAGRAVQPVLAELAQLGRAAGIHLVLGAVDPTEQMLPRRIRADIPVRLALALSSPDSTELILEESGAARRTGCGDALLWRRSTATPTRILCGFVSDQEIETVTAHWKRG
jgi:S-DNA-T family DNA segregation ATPase FtsK/SpoIIIE